MGCKSGGVSWKELWTGTMRGIAQTESKKKQGRTIPKLRQPLSAPRLTTPSTLLTAKQVDIDGKGHMGEGWAQGPSTAALGSKEGKL
jgi:hypothetical protein